jgi:chitinase
MFNSDAPAQFKPFEPVATMRKRFETGTKVMIAIGGWGDTSGFSEGAKDEESRTRYARNVADMINTLGFDGVGAYQVNECYIVLTMKCRY